MGVFSEDTKGGEGAQEDAEDEGGVPADVGAPCTVGPSCHDGVPGRMEQLQGGWWQ